MTNFRLMQEGFAFGIGRPAVDQLNTEKEKYYSEKRKREKVSS